MGKKKLSIMFTDEQEMKLKERADALGFLCVGEYVRFILFMEISFIEKIDQIHEKVCNNDG